MPSTARWTNYSSGGRNTRNSGIIGKVNQLYNSRNRDKAWSGFWVDVLKFLVATATVAIVTWLLIIYKQS